VRLCEVCESGVTWSLWQRFRGGLHSWRMVETWCHRKDRHTQGRVWLRSEARDERLEIEPVLRVLAQVTVSYGGKFRKVFKGMRKLLFASSPAQQHNQATKPPAHNLPQPACLCTLVLVALCILPRHQIKPLHHQPARCSYYCSTAV
jgi:hypothetical protein